MYHEGGWVGKPTKLRPAPEAFSALSPQLSRMDGWILTSEAIAYIYTHSSLPLWCKLLSIPLISIDRLCRVPNQNLFVTSPVQSRRRRRRSSSWKLHGKEILLAYSSCCGKVWKPAASRSSPAVLRLPPAGQPVIAEVPHPTNPAAPAAPAPAGKSLISLIYSYYRNAKCYL